MFAGVRAQAAKVTKMNSKFYIISNTRRTLPLEKKSTCCARKKEHGKVFLLSIAALNYGKSIYFQHNKIKFIEESLARRVNL